MTIAIGIDPGLTGAIAALPPYGKDPIVTDMPVMPFGEGFVKSAVDLAALALILEPYIDFDAHVYIERVNAFPGQGVGSMFSLGMSFWGAAGVAAGLGLPFTLIRPQEWKGALGMSKEKQHSLDLARQLHPSAPLSLKKHHGRAEAILIATYGRMKSLH